jgi:AcrR family transcriptional regulator
MNTSPTKRRRRKEDRPGEIVAAALKIFAQRGFAAAKMEDIAALAGLSKGAVYLYFETKEDVFRAVVRTTVVPNIEALGAATMALDLPFAKLAPLLLARFAALGASTPLGSVVKMVIGESRNFPELAKVWHDDVVQKGIGLIGTLIERAQARGEVRPGDPRHHAFSLIGPMLVGVIWRETFTPVGGAAVDLAALARQHGETVVAGLCIGGNSS